MNGKKLGGQKPHGESGFIIPLGKYEISKDSVGFLWEVVH